MHIIPKYFAPIALCLITSACFFVQDLGKFWDEAKADPALVGQWSSLEDPDKTFSIQAVGQNLIYTNDPSGILMRSIIEDEQRFLLLKDQKEHVNALIHYVVIDKNRIEFYIPDNRDDAIKSKFLTITTPDSNPVGLIQPSVITTLTKDTIKTLATFAQDRENWQLLSTFERQASH